MKLSVAVIVGDDTHAGLATICSLVSQSRKPDQLVIVENPLKRIRLSQQFQHLSGIMAYASSLGIQCSLVVTERLSVVQARCLAEEHLNGHLLMISDGDHFYGHDYLEIACKALAKDRRGRGFYGCVVESFSSTTGLTPQDSTQDLVMNTHDYVAGGSYVYRWCHAGLWQQVLKYTDGLGDDRAWRALCVDIGGYKIMPKKAQITCHMSAHAASKYPRSHNTELIALCERVLGVPDNKNP